MPTEDNFESELIRWRQHCHGITETKSITQLLSEDADPLFFPNGHNSSTFVYVLDLKCRQRCYLHQRPVYCSQTSSAIRTVEVGSTALKAITMSRHSFSLLLPASLLGVISALSLVLTRCNELFRDCNKEPLCGVRSCTVVERCCTSR